MKVQIWDNGSDIDHACEQERDRRIQESIKEHGPPRVPTCIHCGRQAMVGIVKTPAGYTCTDGHGCMVDRCEKCRAEITDEDYITESDTFYSHGPKEVVTVIGYRCPNVECGHQGMF